MNIKNYESLFEHFNEGIYYVDKERKILYYNKAAELISGFSSENVVGCHCYNNIFNHVSEEGVRLCFNGCPLYDSIKRNVINESVVYLQHREGYRLKVNVKTLPILEEGDIVGALEIFTNVQEANLLNETIAFYRKKVMIDPLTEVNNRHILDYDLPEVIKKTESNVAFGVIFLDIDNFKRINDTYGHAMGDKVLKSLAKSLTNSVRKNDVVIRYGGEEFVILAFDVTIESLAVIAEKIRVMVESSSVREDNNDICFTISIGATMIQSKDTLSSAIKRGDEYMYESKKNGKNRVTIR